MSDDVADLPEVIPRVVAAEVDLPADEEVPPVANADPEHEPGEREQQRDMIYPFDPVEQRPEIREPFGELLPALTHWPYPVTKRA